MDKCACVFTSTGPTLGTDGAPSLSQTHCISDNSGCLSTSREVAGRDSPPAGRGQGPSAKAAPVEAVTLFQTDMRSEATPPSTLGSAKE